jgi:predicted NUDIX family NTP pyrophosphohydrolase
MAKQSAGLLMYRRTQAGTLEVFLVHPGGPFFRNRDDGAWTIPKGEPAPGEELLECARREFGEETGASPPDSSACVSLGTVQQAGGKLVHGWAFEGDFDPRDLRCNTFELEWPPRSGQKRRFPEVDRAAFFALHLAQTKLNPAQVPLLDRLLQQLGQHAHPTD